MTFLGCPVARIGSAHLRELCQPTNANDTPLTVSTEQHILGLICMYRKFSLQDDFYNAADDEGYDCFA